MNTPDRDQRHSIGHAAAAAGRPMLHPTWPSRRRLRALAGIAAAATVVASSLLGAGVATAGATTVQALPSPQAFVSNLNLECFSTSPYTPPAGAVVTRHIHPTLTSLPAESNVLGPREQLCAPVATNNMALPPDVLSFIRYVNLACYRTSGITVNQPINLRHLNPVLASTPAKLVTIQTPAQLCLPVATNNLTPPADVFRLLSFIGLKCYGESPAIALNRSLSLSHLNPVLGSLPSHVASVMFNRRVCVPVQLNNQPIPPDVLNIIRWMDLEKYDITAPAALPTPLSLSLRQLNSVLTGLPPETATLTSAQQLMLPMAINNLIPPA